jgi:hypothetical protein
MATRFYMIANSQPGTFPNPTPVASWASTTGYKIRRLTTRKGDALGAETLSGTLTGAAGNNKCAVVLISPPLGAGQISGTVSIVSRGRELATSDNINKRYFAIRVFDSAGTTSRGTLLAFGSTSSTTELSTSPAGQVHANAATLSAVTAQQGDVIAVELGYGESATGTTPQWEMSIGGSGTDHGLSDNSTGAVPWIEFSQDLTYLTKSVPPTLVEFGETAWSGSTATKDTGSITWEEGDLVTVLAGTASDATTISGVSATGLSFTPTEDANVGGSPYARGWSARATTDGSGVVTVTRGSGTGAYGGAVWVWRGSDGLGWVAGDFTVGSTDKSILLPRTYSSSAVAEIIIDDDAGDPAGRTWQPLGETERRAEQVSGQYTVFLADWGSQGVEATGFHGCPGTTSAGFHTKIALEILGTTLTFREDAGMTSKSTLHLRDITYYVCGFALYDETSGGSTQRDADLAEAEAWLTTNSANVTNVPGSMNNGEQVYVASTGGAEELNGVAGSDGTGSYPGFIWSFELFDDTGYMPETWGEQHNMWEPWEGGDTCREIG